MNFPFSLLRSLQGEEKMEYQEQLRNDFKLPPGIQKPTPMEEMTVEQVEKLKEEFTEMLAERKKMIESEETAGEMGKMLFTAHTQLFFSYPFLCNKVVRNLWKDEQVMEQVEWMVDMVKKGQGDRNRFRQVCGDSMVESHWLALARDAMLAEPCEFENILDATCGMASLPKKVKEVARQAQLKVLVKGFGEDRAAFEAAETKAKATTNPECVSVFAAARKICS